LRPAFCFAAATQGWFLVRNRWWETAALLLVTLTLFRPDLYRDAFYPPWSVRPVSELPAIVASLAPGQNMRLRIEIEEKTRDGVERDERTFVLPVTKGPVEDASRVRG
jgi:hypothetical protein